MISLIVISGCSITSNEVTSKIQKYNLNKNQICIENGLKLNKKGECHIFSVITDQHIQHSLNLKRTLIQEKSEKLEFEKICVKADGKVNSRKISDRNRKTKTENIDIKNLYCVTGLGYPKTFTMLEKNKLIQYINKDEATRKSWEKEAETYKTIKELCSKFKSSSYDEEKRVCTTFNKVMGFTAEPSERKFNVMLPIVQKKDKKYAELDMANSIKKWKKEASSYNSTLKNLCYSIRGEYEAHGAKYIDKTSACNLPNKTAQVKYDSMMPIVKARQPEINKKKNALIRAKQLAKTNKDKKENARWEARKSKTHQLISGKSYSCESLFSKARYSLNLGSRSATLSNLSFNFIEDYEQFSLYRGVSHDASKFINLKVYTEKAIDGGFINATLEAEPFFCE